MERVGGPVGVRLLGPVQITLGDQEVTVGSRLQQSVLAMLALDANRVVSTDRLLDGAWSGDSGGSRAALHVHISYLRTALEPHRQPRTPPSVLRSAGDGYLLAIDEGRVDAHELVRLVTEGLSLCDHDPVAAVGVLRRAQDLFQGSPLQGLEDQNFASAVITRLTDHRLDAVAARVAAELVLGRYQRLPAELAELVAAHPLREIFIHQQMLALVGDGRPAEALAAYARYRKYLGEELGLEPSPGLQQLEASVLVQNLDLDEAVTTMTTSRAASASAPASRSGPGPDPGPGDGPGSGAGVVRAEAAAAVMVVEVVAGRRLWLEHGSKMHDAHLRLHHVVATAVTEAGGTVLDDRGDRLVAVFDGLDAAVTAAVESQVAATDTDFEIPLGVRVVVSADIDPSGRPSAAGGLEWLAGQCAQLAAYAPAGAVLVPEPMAAAVTEAGFALSDYGTIRSHGYLQRMGLHVVDDARLQRPVGRLPVAESMSLPRRSSSLVGRERDLATVTGSLASHPVVSIVGPGGVGKTALAVEVAWEAAHRADDGAYFVDLSDARPEGVPAKIATTLGIRTGDDSALTATLGAVAGRDLLLVLDNCEHVTGAVAEVARQWEASGLGARILVTSRRAIGISGERVISLSPLGTRAPATGGGEPAAAVRLFYARAAQAGHALDSSEATTGRVARICRRVDGLPLAVELTAARLRTTTLAGIEAQLARAGPLATTAGTDRLGRDLEQAITWSYDLLPDAERATFCRLGVFRGGFGPEAVAEVGALDWVTAAAVLAELADWSLVARVDDERQVRYRILETVRSFALDRLSGGGGLVDARRRHADHYRAMARAGATGLVGPDEANWVQRIVDDFENLIGAFEWYVSHGEVADAVDMAGSLWVFALQRTEGVRFFAAVEAALGEPAFREHPRRGELLGVAANGAWLRGDPLVATDMAVASIRSEPDRSAPLGQGAEPSVRVLLPARMALLNAAGAVLGSSAVQPEIQAETLDAFTSMRDLCRHLGEPYWLVIPDVLATFGASIMGDHETAASLSSSAVEHGVVAGSQTALAWALLARSAALAAHDPSAAIATCRRALAAASEVGTQFAAALALTQLAGLHRRTGDHESAAAVLAEGLDRWDRLHNAPHTWHAIRESYLLAGAVGRLEVVGPLAAAVEAQSLVFPHDAADMAAARRLAATDRSDRPNGAASLDLRAALDRARAELAELTGDRRLAG